MIAAIVARMKRALAEVFGGQARPCDHYFDGVDIMSPEVAALVNNPTDPDRCDCDHGGLPVGWHRNWCEVSHDRHA